MNYLKIVLGLATVAIILYNVAISVRKTATPYLNDDKITNELNTSKEAINE